MEEKAIRLILNNEVYSYIREEDKNFACQFTASMNTLGYTCQEKIGDGYCYGKHMMIFTKKGVKSNKVYARIYFRTKQMVLRFFFSNITDHAKYIASAPPFINATFTGEYGKCRHCRPEDCQFRKTYTIDDKYYEKCNGLTFEFYEPSVDRLKAYLDLFLQFYPHKQKLNKQ